MAEGVEAFELVELVPKKLSALPEIYEYVVDYVVQGDLVSTIVGFR